MDWNLWDNANFYGRFDKFCEIFTKITLELPQNSQKPLFNCKKLVINTTKCDLCLFLHKMCDKMVWKFCKIWKIFWELAFRWAKFFYLTMWNMACMYACLSLDQLKINSSAIWKKKARPWISLSPSVSHYYISENLIFQSRGLYFI